jgi:hypothetical protein
MIHNGRLVAAVSIIKDMYKHMLSLLKGIGCWTQSYERFVSELLQI